MNGEQTKDTAQHGAPDGAARAGWRRSPRKRRWVALAAFIAVLALGVGAYIATADLRAYHRATGQMQAQDYHAALQTLAEIPHYRDAQTLMDECHYRLGEQAYQDAAYTDAIAYFEQAGSYQDAAEQRNRSVYAQGCALFED